MRKLRPLEFLLKNPRFSPKSSSPPLPDHSLNPFLSRVSSNTFCSWRKVASTASSASLGFLASRILSRQSAAKIHLAALLDSGVRSLRISLQKKRFNVVRNSGSYRQFWGYLTPTPDGTVMCLIGANVVVYYLWRVADSAFMVNHFTISLDNFKSGRLHTMLTSAFSHADFSHLATNMIGLYFCGATIGRLFGPEFLLKLYIAGALGGSIFFLLHKAFIAPSSQGTFALDYSRVTGLGASGAVNAIMLLNIFLFPKEIFYVNLIIPVPAVLLGALIIGSDLWRIKKGDGEISGSAHLGGAAIAAIAWVALKKGWIL
ncbi:RHOMBOID-like protein 12, mitochondrial [Iris pallida]|uniref:RHOMBOID-like protein 12, mitochondrial n=1 Tax=Iris pallida TaxID=29817 RepID=A0AAX6DUP1_IRIPA|nr:RHOMBOID-like protein 12, mitochondrial [Iris pallida]